MSYIRTFSKELERISPYAVWLQAAISLGYGAAWVYQYYQDYNRQVYQDRHNGTQRTFQDAMELVVSPRRRREHESEARERQNEAASTTDIIEMNSTSPRQIQHDISEAGPSNRIELIDLTTNSSEDQENSFHSKSDPPSAPRLSDAQPDEDIGYSLRSDNVLNSRDSNLIDGIEVASTSMSLESTDSNNGMIRDMYNECFICATPFDDTRKPVATLPFCMHPFHKSCLDGLLKWHQRCPICDSHIFSPI